VVLLAEGGAHQGMAVLASSTGAHCGLVLTQVLTQSLHFTVVSFLLPVADAAWFEAIHLTVTTS